MVVMAVFMKCFPRIIGKTRSWYAMCKTYQVKLQNILLLLYAHLYHKCSLLAEYLMHWKLYYKKLICTSYALSSEMEGYIAAFVLHTVEQ